MKRGTVRLGFAVAACLGLLVPAVVQAVVPVPPFESVPGDSNSNRGFYATDSQGNLLSFTALAPERVTGSAIRGLPAGVSLVGIDQQPATGDLYGIGSDSVVYRINPMSAIARAEGPRFEPGLGGRFFGVDFNPTVDKVRLTSDVGQNQRLDPDSGGTVGLDAPLNPGQPRVVGSAYTNSWVAPGKPTATTLYAIDALDDSLCIQNPPNDGTLTRCEELSINVRTNAGFDIAGGNRQLGYIATRGGDAGTALYRVDLTNGNVLGVGRIGDGAATITGLAAVQDVR